MAQPCKVFTYTNVTTEKDALANIRNAAESGGWIIDKDAIDADRELYLHSLGNGSQKLFFSLRLLQAYDDTGKYMLCVHGNTGFNGSAAWDAQPGRFTERIVDMYMSNKSGRPVWGGGSTGNQSNTGWWVVPPIVEQIVCVCSSFVLTAIRVISTLHDGTTYTGWVPLLFGAADGDEGETQLNMVLRSAWGSICAMGLMLSMLYELSTKIQGSWYNLIGNYGTIGVLYGGVNVDCLPDEQDYGYPQYSEAASVVRTSITIRPLLGGGWYGDGRVRGDIVNAGVTITYCYKGRTCPSVPCYNRAVLQNPGTLRNMLIKPLLYSCGGEDIRVIGELPYWAVNMRGLKPKDRIRIGGRVFMVFPDISDSDEIGLAVEVEA